MRFKNQRIIWLVPASLLALSVGLTLNGCEDPEEVSEEDLRVETIDDDESAQPQAGAQADELDRASTPGESAASGWKKNDDDGGGWKHDDDHGGGWKKHDDDHGGGWKKHDDDHGGGWKKHDDDHGGGGWKHDDDH